MAKIELGDCIKDAQRHGRVVVYTGLFKDGNDDIYFARCLKANQGCPEGYCMLKDDPRVFDGALGFYAKMAPNPRFAKR
ncbi:MAG: hypothetical protein QXD43_04170 [Candidatus Aenigmatarchaeota archaeon]